MLLLDELNQVTSDRERLTSKWGKLPYHVDFFSEVLIERSPKRISSLIVLPYSRPHAIKADWVKFVAISHFRFQFSAIEELAKVLAPAAVESGVVPIISPIQEKALKGMSWRTPIINAMNKHGALIYASEQSK